MGFQGGVPAVSILGQPVGVELGGQALLSEAVRSDPFTGSAEISSSTRALLVVVPFAPTLSPSGPELVVTGSQSGFDYTGADAMPMEFYDGQRAFWVVPVDPSLDTEISVTLSRTGFSPSTPGSIAASGSPFDDAPSRFRDFTYTAPKGILSSYRMHVDQRSSSSGGTATLPTARYVITALLLTGISDSSGVTAEATLTYNDANAGDVGRSIPFAYGAGPSQSLPVIALSFRDGLHMSDSAVVTFNGPAHGLYDLVLFGQEVLF